MRKSLRIVNMMLLLPHCGETIEIEIENTERTMQILEMK